MKGFENFTDRQREMIERYAEIVPSVYAKKSRNGRRTYYVISTYEADYVFHTKKAFTEAIEETLKEWGKENGND